MNVVPNGVYRTRRPTLYMICGLLAIILISQSVAGAGPESSAILNDSVRGEVVDSVLNAFGTHYVYPNMAREMIAFIRKKQDNGDYDSLKNLKELTRQLTVDLREFSKDLHIRITVMSPDDFAPAIGDTVTHDKIGERARDNFGFRKAERLAGNIGYFAFNRFDDPAYAGPTAVAGLNFLANCDAIIIDLRNNGGGEEMMVRLIASYFFKYPVEINSLYFTETDSLEQSWTYAFVPGKKMIDTDLYILTSPSTASGAEAFTYGLQQRGRAITVGETTAGAAHWAEYYDFPKLGVRAKVPIARPINPISKTSWERTGVTPDIEIEHQKALAKAYHVALQNLVKKTADDKRRDQLEWYLVVADTAMESYRLSENELTPYTGIYDNGKYRVFSRLGDLYWHYAENEDFILIPLARDLFGFDDTDEIRFRFVRDDRGEVKGFYLDYIRGSDSSVKLRAGDL